MARTPSAAPIFRKFSMRALSFAIAGPEAPYPVYRFGRGRSKLERPRHNPFKGLDIPPEETFGLLLEQGGSLQLESGGKLLQESHDE